MTVPTLIDSHCHIVFRNFEDDLEEVAARWRDAGVVSLLHACVEPAEIPAIRALADRFPEMRYSVGVHPLDTEHWTATTANELRAAALADDRVVAIGELGLDLFRDKNLDEQLAVLGPQLDLAVELGKPVIIHCRDAAEPMLKELRGRAAEGRCPTGVMHCWGGHRWKWMPSWSWGFTSASVAPSLSPRRPKPMTVPARCLRIASWWKLIALSSLQCHAAANATNPHTWLLWPRSGGVAQSKPGIRGLDQHSQRKTSVRSPLSS